MNDNKSPNVVVGHFITQLGIPPDRMLIANIGKMDTVFMCGFDKDGDFIIGASFTQIAEALSYLEMAKTRIMKLIDAD